MKLTSSAVILSMFFAERVRGRIELILKIIIS